jgi:hypothetical protein
MQCRNCGTEIADKALICYRCGTATTEAKYKPFVAPPRRPRWVLLVVVVLALLVLLALFLLNSSKASASTERGFTHEPNAPIARAVRLVDSGDRIDLHRAAA